MARAIAFTLVTLAMLSVPNAGLAQQTSSIGGVVRDASGGVLPGVTVEAASPALIEKVRVATTDGEGRFNVVDLRPGTYAVTFTLPGFNTLRRDGISLTGGFAATVNADLQVGALEQMITVSGEAPLVDTQTVRKQIVMSDDLLNVLPTSMKSQQTVISFTPGLTGMADVAGSYSVQLGGSFHGKSGTKVQVDGMSIQNLQANGATGYQINAGTVQEMTVQTSGMSAESSADGIVVNVIPKEGGNTFSGSTSGLFANDRLGTSNLTDELRARGLTTVSKLLKVYDVQGTLGGPIKADRLWFFGSARYWGSRNQNAGSFANKTQGSPFYTPDPDRPATREQWYTSYATRVTWQAAARHKINVFGDWQDGCNCGSTTGIGQPPESWQWFYWRPQYLLQASWSAPLTTRLLVEAGATRMVSHSDRILPPSVTMETVSINDQALGLTYNANTTYDFERYSHRNAQRASVSYVTGSHAVKVGVQVEQGFRYTHTGTTGGNVNYRFNNGVPNQITQYATPYGLLDKLKADLGVYAQDQWTIRRLSLNYGLRFEYFNGYVPAQNLPATPSGWIPARSFSEVRDVPAWKDLNPRLGAAYDLFGDGRTAAKVSVGRYVAKYGVDLTNLNNPIQTSVNSVTRTWADANLNYVPDCNLAVFTANGECGPISNTNFGGSSITTRYADDVMRGFGVRGYNWDVTAELQRQVTEAVSVTGGYYRNWFGNFNTTDNQAVVPEDYSTFCITAPVDPRLPGGGGYPICGLADVSLAKFGLVSNAVERAANYGRQTQVNDFFGVSLNARFDSGARVTGGVDTGRSATDNCFVVDSPQQLVNCKTTTPFRGQTQVKVNGSYPLPYDFVLSGILQNLSGPAITATYAASNAEVAPSLGRNLAACGTRTPCTSTATVPLIVPGTEFEGRTTRVDLRLTKMVSVNPRLRLQLNLDVYNALNSSDILSITTTFGPRWRQPTQLLDPRIMQFSGQLTF